MAAGHEKSWLILIILMTCNCQHAAADILHPSRYTDLYFPRFVYSATLYGDHDVMSPIAQVIAVSRGNVTVTYGIRHIACGEDGDETVAADSGVFSINPQDGRVYTSVNNPRCEGKV
ncbi:uncharacterized protein LOC144904721 [Branchiostoma floridae x Branchiostoma belcheri]